jgi:hypothetical protein
MVARARQHLGLRLEIKVEKKVVIRLLADTHMSEKSPTLLISWAASLGNTARKSRNPISTLANASDIELTAAGRSETVSDASSL